MKGAFMTAVIKVNNPPKKFRKYIVVRLVDSSLWYYATYDTEEEAKNVAREVDGFIAEVV